MSVPLSVDDAFTVGVSFDLLGGYLLGRGLLESPHEIARRTIQSTVVGHGFNAAEAATHIQSRTDALVGLMSLAIGFALQWGGYVALIAKASVETGLDRAAVSVVLALIAAGAAFEVFRRVRWRRVKRFTVLVARANPAWTLMDDLPDRETLIALARALGIGVVEVSSEGADLVDDWARETFGVEGTFRRVPVGMSGARRDDS